MKNRADHALSVIPMPARAAHTEVTLRVALGDSTEAGGASQVGDIVVTYVPVKVLVEAYSLKRYVEKLHAAGQGVRSLCRMVSDTVQDTCRPAVIRVKFVRASVPSESHIL